MSTKVTIAWREKREGQAGFHLYEDVLDSLGADDGCDAPVYLRLDGVTVDLRTLNGGGAAVTIALPRELAHVLGLLRPRTGPNTSEDSAG